MARVAKLPLCLVMLMTVPFVATAGEHPLKSIQEFIPDAHLDIRYATPNNFTGEVLYDRAVCFVRPDVGRLLRQVDDQLKQHGLRLLFFDCYRPRAVQYRMWAVYPKPGYVADPRSGSHHNRAGAVDVGIIGADGNPVAIPTDFDAFHPAAASMATLARLQTYPPNRNKPAAELRLALTHRVLLQFYMRLAGFAPSRSEWWHFNCPRPKTYPVMDVPFCRLVGERCAPGN